MTAISVHLPDATHRRAQALAAAEGVTLDELVSSTVDMLVQQEETLNRMRQRAERGAGVNIDAIFSKVPDVSPEAGDELDK